MKPKVNGKRQATLSRFFTPTKKAPSLDFADVNGNAKGSKRPSDEVKEVQKRHKVDEDQGLDQTGSTFKAPSDDEEYVEPAEELVTNVPDDLQTKTPLTKLVKLTRAKASNGEAKAPKSGKSKLTPLEQQFKDLKLSDTDLVLAIQVGYKFKFFGQDAVVVSQLLNIMLIPGNIQLDNQTHDRFAYCLIPDNRLHVHLQRLLNNGLKVGVVKQTETAAVKSVDGNKSGLFERKITGIYTKGTYMGDELLTGDPTINRANTADYVADSSYIVCIDELKYPKETAIVAVQPVTGSIVYDLFSDNVTRDQLESRLAFLNPSEAVVVGIGEDVLPGTRVALRLQNATINTHYVRRKSAETIQANLHDFFPKIDLTGRSSHLAEFYTLNFPETVQSCINELIEYLSEFKLSSVFTISANFVSLTNSKMYMLLPIQTLRALDIFEVQDDPSARKGTLLWLLNHTHTRKGLGLLRSWISKPLVNKEDIQKRLDAVVVLNQGTFVHLLDTFKKSLANLGKSGVDLDRSLIKVHYSATYHTDKISRKDFYIMLKSFADVLQLFKDFGDAGLHEFHEKYPNCQLLREILRSMSEASKNDVLDGFLAQINASKALEDKDLSKQKIGFFNTEKFPQNFREIEQELDELATIDLLFTEELSEIRAYLKRPQLSYVTVLKDTHLIEVRNGKTVDSLPSDWLKISATKSISRFRPPKVASLHKKRRYHHDRLLGACDEAFNRFLQNFDSHYVFFKEIVQNLATFDCLWSLAKASTPESNVTYAQPTFVDEQIIEVENASHPILLRLRSQALYVPNDVNLSYLKERMLIITGPNMGGKSSYVKQIALLVIMAQIGCILPCTRARMGIFDSIFVRMGASDDILKGKSTFMVEMLESANIVNLYTPKSLVILDEIGRGTGTADGIALAHSILKYVIEDKAGPLTLFITHYPSLHVLESEYLYVKNYHMAFIEMARDGMSKWPEVIFLYKLVKGVVSNLYGLNVANMAGIDSSIIEAAYDISERMKKQFEHQKDVSWFNQLDLSDIKRLLNTI
ncbi:hypothetical protein METBISCDRAFT_12979 [Metschnikowia bicuspidata]|uniref:DNA mismatch repair protein MSH3 n=1 Tax=Metschnikowia bicuspidata TaxID=27322 RepID=A0A4V1J3G7_9ASCO|nr:hypothetical protein METBISCDRAFT_12979 [Metschnikowia bicuspidata]